jgi:hypothetical protein
MRWIAGPICALVLAGCGAEAPDPEREAGVGGGQVAVADAEPARDDAAQLPPLPDERSPRVVEPEAGIAGEVDDDDPATGIAESGDPPKPSAPASSTRRRGAVPAAIDGSLRKATALSNGVALPPLEAPVEVLKVIEAGNAIARSPYKWGGGHGRFLDDGYDCSGSVSFALYAAGLIEGSRTSGGLMSWGRPGKGKWITIYTNPGHVYMVVAGIRFDTSGARQTGSRWQNDLRSTSGYVARHPPGL